MWRWRSYWQWCHFACWDERYKPDFDATTFTVIGSNVHKMALQILQTGILQNVIVLLYFFNWYIYRRLREQNSKHFCWADHHYFKTAASNHGTFNHSNSVSPQKSLGKKYFALPCKTVLYVCIYFSDCLYLVTIVKCMIP